MCSGVALILDAKPEKVGNSQIRPRLGVYSPCGLGIRTPNMEFHQGEFGANKNSAYLFTPQRQNQCEERCAQSAHGCQPFGNNWALQPTWNERCHAPIWYAKTQRSCLGFGRSFFFFRTTPNRGVVNA